ncbi:MAG: hypothetical protein C4341_10130 [Armatimonadota bacterium]
MVEAVFRVRRVIERHGETFHAGGSDHKGVFGIISSAVAKRYATSAAVDGANRPLWMVVVRDDDTTQVTDTVVWAGLSLTILAIVERRLRGAVVLKVIVAH